MKVPDHVYVFGQTYACRTYRYAYHFMYIGYIYVLSTNPCDMYMSSQRHIHDPVLSSQDENYKGKVIPLRAQWPLGFWQVKAPEFLDTRHMKVVRSSPLRTGRLYPQEYPGTHFQRLSRTQGTWNCLMPRKKFPSDRQSIPGPSYQQRSASTTTRGSMYLGEKQIQVRKNNRYTINSYKRDN